MKYFKATNNKIYKINGQTNQAYRYLDWKNEWEFIGTYRERINDRYSFEFEKQGIIRGARAIQYLTQEEVEWELIN